MHYINSNACDITTLMVHVNIYSHYNSGNMLHMFIQY